MPANRTPLHMSTLNDYFKRLEITPRPPAMELVAELQQKHIAELCFNSLAVLLQRPISLELPELINKIALQNLGGYCFEHNKLMHDALKELGFEVRCLIGKVVNNQEIDTPRTHRITLLTWEGEHYLVDVGFGANCMRQPMLIREGHVSEQGGLTYRIVNHEHDDYQLELITTKGSFSLYRFNLHHYTEADCVMGNFYSCQHPQAVFVNNLVVSRVLPGLTLSLRNNQYHRIRPDNTEVTHIVEPAQLQTIIKEDFGIQLTDDECELLFRKTCVSN